VKDFFVSFGLVTALLLPLALYFTRDTWMPVDCEHLPEGTPLETLWNCSTPIETPPPPPPHWEVIPGENWHLDPGESVVEQEGALEILPAPYPVTLKKRPHRRVQVQEESSPSPNGAPIIE
jgi:hypothetical protein